MTIVPHPRFLELTPPHQALMRLLQRVDFGSVSFVVRSGAPDLKSPHRVVRTLKLGGSGPRPRPETTITDFELRREHTALLAQLAALADGTRVKVKVAHGLPGPSIDLEEDHRAA